jgi:hypothetical protein
MIMVQVLLGFRNIHYHNQEINCVYGNVTFNSVHKYSLLDIILR